MAKQCVMTNLDLKSDGGERNINFECSDLDIEGNYRSVVVNYDNDFTADQKAKIDEVITILESKLPV